MEEKIKKEVRAENEAYKERFQFLLEVNDFTICQRYFKVNDFIPSSIDTLEFTKTMDSIVEMLKRDLERKSRIYQWCTVNRPLKMTGLMTNPWFTTVYRPDFEGEPEYLTVEVEEESEQYRDTEELKPYDVTFKLTMLIDEKPVYSRIWDGTVYPKYVRNSVDLLNYTPQNRDVLSMSFKEMLRYRMTVGEPDLTFKMIKMVYETISGKDSDREYTTRLNYANVENGTKTEERVYSTNYQREFIEGWRNYTKKKTLDYFRSIGLPAPKGKRKK